MQEENFQRPKPAVLLILDGFGTAPDTEGNAVTRAFMPNFKKFVQAFPAMTLRASGEEVGLSWGEMGNSQVGHLAIGAGRVYYQMFPRINKAIESGAFFENQTFVHAAEFVKEHQSTLHLVGLVSSGRVHSTQEHCHALLDFAKRQKVKNVAIHVILDGRDTLYNAGIDFVTTLQEKIQEYGIGRIASLSGRYYAMDRDNRWDRTQKAYEAMVLGNGPTTEDPLEALKHSYVQEIYDEQFVPTVVTQKGKPVALIQEKDAIIFFNFRPDRMRQITKAFVLPTFEKFERTYQASLLVVTMAEFEKGLPVEIAFPPEQVERCLAQVLSEAGLKQFHIAETEKYAHVTFFLNGSKEKPFPQEDREIIASPGVDSYDQVPEMSAYKITDRLVKEIKNDRYDFLVANFANPDMVAHTGNFEATVKACEIVDACLGKIVEATLRMQGVVFLTADHGNAEEVKNIQTGGMDKEHSTNPVPFLVIGEKFRGVPAASGQVIEGDLSLVSPIGMLADVTPTILSVLGITQPEEMTGQSLL